MPWTHGKETGRAGVSPSSPSRPATPYKTRQLGNSRGESP
jgi:hypothetical protein